DLDSKVARTAARPVASGRVSKKAAWVWLVSLCLVGLIVLLQLRLEAQIVALASLALAAAYPFMKRITWWPQAWLGMVFNWGLLVGWSQVGWAVFGDQHWDAVAALYLGCVSWVIGYDTIYALQDREDDALVGIRSSALRMGARVHAGIAGFYAATIALWSLGVWLYRPDPLALLALLPVALHLVWQVATLDPQDPANPLDRFRSNRWAGALMAAACFVVGNAYPGASF
ncbi:MAG: 4-hydroxybenzoate octaprenyltransferase, partial [Pseudomonadota bacterium]